MTMVVVVKVICKLLQETQNSAIVTSNSVVDNTIAVTLSSIGSSRSQVNTVFPSVVLHVSAFIQHSPTQATFELDLKVIQSMACPSCNFRIRSKREMSEWPVGNKIDIPINIHQSIE